MAQHRFGVCGAPQRGHMAASVLGEVLHGMDLVVLHFSLVGLRQDFPVIVTGIRVDFFDRDAPLEFTGVVGPTRGWGQVGSHQFRRPEMRKIRGRITDPVHRTGWIEVSDELAVLLRDLLNVPEMTVAS